MSKADVDKSTSPGVDDSFPEMPPLFFAVSSWHHDSDYKPARCQITKAIIATKAVIHDGATASDALKKAGLPDK